MTPQKTLHLKTFFLILVMVIAGPLGNVLLSKGMKQAGRDRKSTRLNSSHRR